jgi:hypothetical protein
MEKLKFLGLSKEKSLRGRKGSGRRFKMGL